MRTRNAAVNAVRQEVVDYGPDPRRAAVLGLGADLIARVQGCFTAAYRGDQSDPSQSFYGYGPPLQKFTGTGGRNSVVYTDPAMATLPNAGGADVESIDDPTMRILAERLRRRQT